MNAPIELPTFKKIDILTPPLPSKGAPLTLPVPSRAPTSPPPNRTIIEPDDYKKDAPPGFDIEPKSPMGNPTRTRPIPMRKAIHKPGHYI